MALSYPHKVCDENIRHTVLCLVSNGSKRWLKMNYNRKQQLIVTIVIKEIQNVINVSLHIIYANRNWDLGLYLLVCCWCINYTLAFPEIVFYLMSLLFIVVFSPVKRLSKSEETYAQIKHSLQVKTVQNSCKQTCQYYFFLGEALLWITNSFWLYFGYLKVMS